MNSFSKLFLAVVLAGVAAFSIFGFLASFELAMNTAIFWAAGYAILGLTSAVGSIALGRSAISDPNTTSIRNG